ncbi:MAG: hypothetical protein U5L11_06525 [Arhodomonas sp.]|nr:hypothetical protein [Arhodomonas sp.]
MPGHRHDPLEPKLPQAPGEWLRWHDLSGDSLALALAAAARVHTGPLLVVSPAPQQAQALAETLRFFAGEGLAADILPAPGKPCPTTSSRRTRTSSPSACARSTTSRRSARVS